MLPRLADGARLLTFPALRGVPGLRHAVTTREGGESVGPYATLDLGLSAGDAPESVARNRRAVAAALGADGVLFLHQVHGREVACATRTAAPAAADAVVVDRPGVLAGVLGADCALLLVVDPARRALALVHAGWRGVVAGVVGAAVSRLVEREGSEPSVLRVGLGPAICGRCYEVGPEVAGAVREAVPDAGACLHVTRAGRPHLDLRRAIRSQLEGAGVRSDRVEQIGACTREERELWFSHRRDGARTGRHAIVAGWT